MAFLQRLSRIRGSLCCSRAQRVTLDAYNTMRPTSALWSPEKRPPSTIDSDVNPASDARSSQSRRSRRSGSPAALPRDGVSASKSIPLEMFERLPNWKLKPPCESVCVSVRSWPLHPVWTSTTSVSTLPSSTTTLPLRKILVLGDRSGDGMRGRVLPVRRPPPPPPVCPNAVTPEIESRQAQTSRVLMGRPQATTFPKLYA